MRSCAPADVVVATLDERFPGWVATHPVLWGVVSGSLLLLLTLALFGADFWLERWRSDRSAPILAGPNRHTNLKPEPLKVRRPAPIERG